MTDRHWVRLTTACNNACLFCLDNETPRDLCLDGAALRREIRRGIEELGAKRVILSGGEPTLHPEFVELVRFARSLGYGRVQTVTNGSRLAEPRFLAGCLDAGLGEVTFSLHGHTADLHDRLTGTRGSFARIVKAIHGAVRDGRPIVSIDVVLNQQNIAVLDRIIELGISLGVYEFDLLQIIPHGGGFAHRDQLFYDVTEHLPTLRRLFKLSRHPRVTIWTNRLPAQFLEGFEELIQAPAKLFDEVGGRREALRQYLDQGTPLSCREAERCAHCFVEPFCTNTDRAIERLQRDDWAVWWPAASASGCAPLPFGCTHLGVETLREHPPAVDEQTGFYVRQPVDVAELPEGRPMILALSRPRCLASWLERAELPEQLELEVHLNPQTAAWLLAHRTALARHAAHVRIHQPTYDDVEAADREMLHRPADFFAGLELELRASGLPACQATGARLADPPAHLDAGFFDTDGRLELAGLVRHHLRNGYFVKSTRCGACPVQDGCQGAHINWIRARGFRTLQPLTDGAWAEEAVRQLGGPPPVRLATGMPSCGPAPTLVQDWRAPAGAHRDGGR